MSTTATGFANEAFYPVRVQVQPATEHRNRLTTAFRLILALPHLILVGGPVGFALSWGTSGGEFGWWGGGGGVLGVAAAVCAVIAWCAIIVSGRHPGGLWSLAAFYLRWRVRVAAYAALLRHEYPPFSLEPA